MKIMQGGAMSVVVGGDAVPIGGLLFATTVSADSWVANDSGNDNPDGYWAWYAPSSSQHESTLCDIDTSGATDQLLDHYMQWKDNIDSLWYSNRNIVHEVRTDDGVYESDDWYWANLDSSPDHNEDSPWAEEQIDGYEEKELGWSNPVSAISPYTQYTIYTGHSSLENSSTYFESESELTDDGWYPLDLDYLGRLTFCCVH